MGQPAEKHDVHGLGGACFPREGQAVHRIDLEALPQGTYTLVAWQTASSGVDPWWWLAGADQLATARLVQSYPSTIAGQYAIGLCTTTLSIGSEAPVIDVEMEPMGRVVDISVDGLTPECDYSYASLVIWSEEPRVEGFYLNPACSGEDRWVYSDTRKESDLSFGAIPPSMPARTDFTLSHGEKKRVSIGVELVADRALLCLDEPDAGLDPLTKRELFRTLKKLAHERGASVIVIIHDVAEIALFDQVIMLLKADGTGRMAYSGTPEEALRYFQRKSETDPLCRIRYALLSAHRSRDTLPFHVVHHTAAHPNVCQWLRRA